MNQNVVDILLVEDNPRDTELTIRALNKHNNTSRIVVLEDGAEALDFIFCKGKFSDRVITNQPKVILLDLKLPKVDGLEALRKIKSDQRTKMIPVVMVTSSKQESDMKAAYEYGANSYVVKPVDFNTFVEAMSHLVLYWLLVNQSSK
ncbi:MAG: response regulator [Ignavibacteriae bacterium]|nr:MAG: response regulator [Ignavibacteriota bacterium]